VSVIGFGAMGRRHARVLRSLSARFDLAGVYDVHAELEVPRGLARFASASEAIERAEVVVVSTPNAAHAPVVSQSLAAGRHVLVEKPVCASSAEAYALAASATGAARLFVGHSERFNPVVRVLARLLRGDDALAFDVRRVGPSMASASGVLLNLGVHDFDLAAYLTRGPVKIHGAVGRTRAPDGTEDEAHVVFSTSGGAVGHLHVDRTAPAKSRTLSVVTPAWTYQGDLLAHRLVRVSRSAAANRAASEVPLPLDEPLAAQAIALADALDGAPGREIATGHDGAAAVALAEEAASLCRAVASAEPRSALRRTPG
jgi:predicted dehydrogenase